MKPWLHRICVIVGLVSASSLSLFAQEQKGDSSAAKKSPSENSQETDKGATAPKPVVGKLPPHSGMARPNPVEKILRGMQLSETKVRASDTSPETLETQKQIVKDLDVLIKALQQQQRQPPPPSSSPQDSQQPEQNQNQQQQQSQQERKQAQPMNSREQQEAERRRKEQQRKAQTQSEADKSRESGPRRDAKSNPKPEEGSTAGYEKDVWGHLPPAMRQELLNIYREKFIPKYDDMVRKYYEALSAGGHRPESHRPANRGSNTP